MPEGSLSNPLLVRDLSVEYSPTRNPVRALSEVTFSLEPGKTLCCVGASGSSKTTLVRAILGILPRGTCVQGVLRLPGGRTWNEMTEREAREYRRCHVGAIFQDAAGSLIPGVPVGRQIERVFRMRRDLGRPQSTRAAEEALYAVGFDNCNEVWNKVPAALSGGMCQRCVIAMGLLGAPVGAPGPLQLVCADEPTGSLDSVSAAQILDLLIRVQRDKGATMLFITHDVRLVSRFDQVAVLSHGRIVEFRSSAEFLAGPTTGEGRALLEASRSLGECAAVSR